MPQLPTTCAMPGRVWYASYGSNLCAARFHCYIAGGSVPGMTKACPGAADASLPAATVSLLCPGSYCFAFDSQTWGGGGVAFMHPAVAATGAAAAAPDQAMASLAELAHDLIPADHAVLRAHSVTLDQFWDVVQQENPSAALRLPGAAAVMSAKPGDAWHVCAGWYGRVICVGRWDDAPVLTFTHPDKVPLSAHAAPSAAYAQVIWTGLQECGVQSAAATAYLRSRGVPDHTMDAVHRHAPAEAPRVQHSHASS